MAFELGRFLAIEDNVGSVPLNHSDIAHSQDKLRNYPVWQVQGPGMGAGVTKYPAPAPDGYREAWAADTTEIKMAYLVPWTGRHQFITWAIGYSTNTNKLRRVTPWQHPNYPWLYATDAQVTGVGAPIEDPNAHEQGADGGAAPAGQQAMPVLPAGAGIINNQAAPAAPPGGAGIVNQRLIPMLAFMDNRGDTHWDGYAVVEVTFRPLDYEVRDDDEAARFRQGELSRYVSREINYNVQGIAASQIFKDVQVQPVWAEDTASGRVIKGNPIPEAGLLLFPTAQLHYTWHQVPDVPWENIRKCLGKVNVAPFDGVTAYQEFDPGTLLCQAPRVVRKGRSVAGHVMWDITYVFDYKPEGWNNLPYGDGNYYAFRLGKPPAGVNALDMPTLFPDEDFDLLFQLDPGISYQAGP